MLIEDQMNDMKYVYLTFLLFMISRSGFSQENNQIIDETYNINKIKEITEFLASDELEGRDTPSKGLDLAAEYISSFFETWELKSPPNIQRYYQSVKMVSSKQPDNIKVKMGEQFISTQNSILHVSGQEILTEGYWTILDSVDQDLENMDLRNRIILYTVDRNNNLNPRQIILESRRMKAIAIEKEAAGLIEIFKGNNRFWDRFNNYYSQERIGLDQSQEGISEPTHIVIRDIDSFFNEGIDDYSNNEISIEIVNWNKKRFVTNNIIGMVEGIDPVLKNEFIICTAHYDHVGIGRPDNTGDSIYNGARDNAIGVMSVMMAAENISKIPVKRSILFVLFTGEEKGLLGSRWFVENSPVPLKDILFCLNIDGGGYNDTTIATIMGYRRVESHDIFKNACADNAIEAFDGTDNSQFLFNNSDNIMFSQKGIPSITFSPGFRDLDAEIMKYYHQPSDEVESMDFNYIEKYSKAIGLSLRMIADSEERLFWKEGDEFYTLGQELYK